jgi:hypothetical protein
MSTYTTSDTITYNVDGKSYEIDYSAKLFFDEHRADEVEVSPSFGEVIPNYEDFEEDIKENALDHANKKFSDRK